ncbi:MAG: Hsp33 family molecular chaperone HslO [Lachnospiraceae bacterium]|nr:Hsp33 family molecular chaperone HslO [Lachnospiraceae bacterium]
MKDYIVRATAADDAIRAFAINSKELVQTAQTNHNTSPIATAALGRMLSAGAMMGVMMKGEDDLLTLQVLGSGPIHGITVTANAKGEVKGFANETQIDLPLNDQGKLNVGGAVGVGILRVIKDMGLKEPYVGTVPIQTGEIAEDLTYYFASSEQVPSSVGLGVLVDVDGSVLQAGGFIIQLMPFASDEVVEQLENNIKNIESVTNMLSKGMTPEDIINEVLAGFEVKFLENTDAKFVCDCSSERVERSLIALGDEDVADIIADGKPIEVKCQFCNKAYEYTIEELIEMRNKAKK